MNLFEIFINILIYLNIYWYYIVPLFALGFYHIILTYFQFPLITNKIHELVILISPEKIKVKKITNRVMPFFTTKNGIYWFDKPCHDVDSLNQIHTYINEINQPITKMKRRENKVNDLMTNQFVAKQVTGHKLLILRHLKKHFHRHYTLVIDTTNDMYQLKEVPERQALKVNFWHTIGIYLQQSVPVEQEQDIETSSGVLSVKALTTQTILQEVKYIQEHSYYSSSYAYHLLKKLVKMERYYITWLTGAIDPKVIIALLGIMGACAAAFLFTQMYDPMASLGEMPTS